jgi:hypothetical protein
MSEVIKRTIAGIEVEIRILDDGVDLVLPHIHKEYAVCILDLFHMIPSEERSGSNGTWTKRRAWRKFSSMISLSAMTQ